MSGYRDPQKLKEAKQRWRQRHPQEFLENKNRYTRTQHEKRLEYMRKIKIERGCCLCGYNDHHVALHFDHIDPMDKTSEVSTICWQEKSFKRIDAEIAKYRVVCANCHMVETYENGQFGMSNKPAKRRLPSEIQITLKFDD